MFHVEFDLFAANIHLWLICSLVFLLIYNYLTKEPWKKLPPGPLALPLLGSVPFLGKDIREPLMRMAAKYGNVFTIYLGQRRVVILSGYDVIKEAFVKHGYIFSGRPFIYLITGVMGGLGLISSQGLFWREQRRHALSVLRDFGFGSTLHQERILHEVSFFIRELRKHADRPYCPQRLLQLSVANVIASVAFGNRFDYDDPTFKWHIEKVNDGFEILGNSGIITIFPFLRHLPGDLFRIKQLLKDRDSMEEYFRRMIEEHEVAIKEGRPIKDFITVYLNKLEQERHKKDSTFSVKQLIYILIDLFGAGSETTSTTLTWAILYMGLNPDIQAKVRAEIDDVIGRENVPRVAYRDRMPLTEACILESQRLGDVVPLGVPHANTEDILFRGYFIPKGTMVMANLYSAHRDPELWPEPERFNPERFIDETGKLIRREELIPFSLGKRLCVGASLAKIELFLYFTSILQNFTIRMSPEHPRPDLRGKLSMTNMPHPPCYVILETR